MSERARFWSDDFDMDLLKIIPWTEEILGEAADVGLVTTCIPTYGRINHPDCWNTKAGLTAFFGFESPARPEGFAAADYVGTVACSFLEATRDAWPHQYLILVEGQPVWDTQRLWPVFQDLMFNLRGWRLLPEHRVAVLLGQVERSLAGAAERLLEIQRDYLAQKRWSERLRARRASR